MTPENIELLIQMGGMVTVIFILFGLPAILNREKKDKEE